MEEVKQMINEITNREDVQEIIKKFLVTKTELAEEYYNQFPLYLNFFFILQAIQISYEIKKDKKYQNVHWLFQFLIITLIISGGSILAYVLLHTPLPFATSLSSKLPLIFLSWFVFLFSLSPPLFLFFILFFIYLFLFLFFFLL